MRKITFNNTFFKDILFNKFAYKKYLKMNKVLLLFTIPLNIVFFLCYGFTGISLVNEIDIYMRLINALLVSGIFTINHRRQVNNINFYRDLNVHLVTDYYSKYEPSIEVVPKNFVLYDDITLSSLRKVYKEGAYLIVSIKDCEYVFFAKDDEVYLVSDEDKEMESVKTLRLSRELI